MSPKNLENISNLEGWPQALFTYRKIVVSYHFNLYVVHTFLFFISNTFISNVKLKLAKNQANAKHHCQLNFCCYSQSSFILSSKNNRTHSKKKKKNMYVCIHETIYLIMVKMLMKMKNWWHRHDINSLRSRDIVNKRIVSVWWCLYVCIKQHLSIIWSSVHEKVK